MDDTGGISPCDRGPRRPHPKTEERCLAVTLLTASRSGVEGFPSYAGSHRLLHHVAHSFQD